MRACLSTCFSKNPFDSKLELSSFRIFRTGSGEISGFTKLTVIGRSLGIHHNDQLENITGECFSGGELEERVRERECL